MLELGGMGTHQHFKLWILKANQLPFYGDKIGSTLLLIFFVAGVLCSVADHWVHILPLQNSSQSQNFDIHKYLNNHGKF